MFVVRKIFMDYVVPDKKGVFFCIADIVTNITHFCKLQINNVTMRLLQGDLITLRKHVTF